MSFLTIAGIPCLVLADNSASEQPREYGGSLRHAWDGSLRNTTRWRKRQWAFTIAPMVQSDFAALDAATSLRQIVACSGAALGGAVNCAVVLQSGSFMAAHNEAQSAPLFYSMTVGDGAWDSATHTSRVAGAFACSDGILLDQINDASAVVYVQEVKILTFDGADPKLVRFRVARSGATVAGVSIYDPTDNVHRALAFIDFTGVVPVITNGSNGGGEILSVVARGDGSYEVTMQTGPVVAGRAVDLIVYPTIANAATVGSIYVGQISVWDDTAGTVGFRRTMALTLMEA